jgi:trk system potassium uptake protein TrkH
MKKIANIRLLAIIIGGINILMLPSLIMAFALAEFAMVRAFLIPLSSGFVLALLAIFFMPKSNLGLLRAKDGFLLVFITWIFATLSGSFPYYLAPINMNFTDAIFESACGFTTTGAATIMNVEALPLSLILWRSISYWAGGMGIILLTVALMPLLGVGGFQLIKAETSGLEKDKLTPKIADAAKILWGVYFLFTLLLILLYRLGGMNWFDAVCNSFSILSTSGVSTRNSGFGYFNSSYIDWITVVFMIFGAINFNLYFRIAKGKYKDLLQNTEIRVFFFIIIFAALIVSFCLIPQYGSFGKALRFGTFQCVSILTTTGNARENYANWPGLAQWVLFSLMFIGGCSNSTASGIKVVRYVVLFKQAVNELRRTIYPQGVFSIMLNKKVGRKDVVYGVSGFIFLYFAIVAVTTLVTALSGFDIFTSFVSALSLIGNIGTGFGKIAPDYSYSVFPAHLKLFYSLVMISGRLELWTVFVLFSSEYWKR